MKKSVVLTGVIFLLFWVQFLFSTSVFAGELKVCEIFSKGDAEALFNEPVSDGKMRKATFPAGETCRYTYKKNGDVYGIKVRLSPSSSIREEGINESAADVMARQKKARSGSAQADRRLEVC